MYFNIYIYFNYKQKTDIFVVTRTTKLIKIVKYNIDSQSFENLYILNILNATYISNYILQCAAKIWYFS